jgi:hypothetical protein
MKATTDFMPEDLSDSILSSQYYDLVSRRRAKRDGEYRLLWAVLEDAIKTYLANKGSSNPAQRKTFEQVRAWFDSPHDNRAGIFGFQSICDFLEIDSIRLLNRLKSLRPALPNSHYRVVRISRIRNLAA